MRDPAFDGERDCLRPVRHEHSNIIMLAPPGTAISDLHAELVADEDRNPIVLSTWELTAEQRQRVAEGAQVTLMIWEYPMPPVALAIDNVTPIEETRDEDDRRSAPDANEAAVRADFHPDRSAINGGQPEEDDRAQT